MVKDNSFENKPLIEEFKRRINRVIWRKLIEVECSLRSIKQ